MTGTAAPSPVSRPLDVSRLAAGGRAVSIGADADQRAALAEIHGLETVDGFRAELVVRPWQRDGVRVTGEIVADIVQQCVVTLEPLPARLAVPVDATFVPRDSRLARRLEQGEGQDVLIDPEGPDAPETFDSPFLDIGAVAEEFFALAIDPYPHKPGAGPVEMTAGEDDQAEQGPFAALDRLRKAR
ncbi:MULTISPECIES: DUF177 domain-containing protein [unclassified Roseitalea]|uniref:YceD family protein n=1 Tax=unclassified Roseitalea TaxID=2639107 RepID=UPI00273F5839|nr:MULTISPECIES: DUF177 domain-containing protein [unclassified Roseitalea]